MRLILVRHAQTIWHAEGRYVGKADMPLDDTGIRQAELVVSRLADVKLDAVYSSPLSRCLLLANMVGQAHALDVTTDERLQEMDLGKWSGQKYDAVAERDGETLGRWLEEPATVTLPGGESLLDVRERSLSWLEDAVGADLGRTVLVSSHSTPIKVMLTLMMGLSPNDVHRFSVGLASVSQVTYDGHRSNLELLNDVCHLRDLPPGRPAGY